LSKRKVTKWAKVRPGRSHFLTKPETRSRRRFLRFTFLCSLKYFPSLYPSLHSSTVSPFLPTFSDQSESPRQMSSQSKFTDMSSSTSSSMSIPGGSSPTDHSRQPVPAAASGDTIETSTSTSSSISRTQTFHFSSGNPRIEETRGIMHLFSEDSPSHLPIGRKPLVSVIGVPNHMTYADFCKFCGSFTRNILEMRIVRNDEMEDRYSILMRFQNQDSTDKFYLHFNGREFNSLEEEVCRVRFTIDVQFTGYSGSLEHSQHSPTSTAEQSSCPVCLERLDQDMGGILTTICNHSFHCSCISKWADSSCPVCRYCQQQPEKSVCFICQTSENLWMCVICGFVGCGRNKEGHAVRHWKETEHCYSLELETQRVWDYAGDNYVHRLIQSKTDGKLVELHTHCARAGDGCGCVDSGINDTLLSSKVEAIVSEYDELLTAQLENQKQYFEGLLQEVKEETDRKKSEAVKKVVSQKLQKMQARLEKCTREKQFLDELNENLLKNKEIWKVKIAEMEEREKKAVKLKDDKIQILEVQLEDLMAQLEAGNSPVEEDETAAVTQPVQSNSSAKKTNGSKKEVVI
ncbi:BRAP2 RING ZnF UBP domain-containing protein 2, partial [Linum grandiflorum]